MSTIEVKHDGAIWIAGDLYCTSPEAVAVSLETLRAIGYEVEDQRVDRYAIKGRETTPEQMEQNGWTLWFAKLPELRKGKCNSCGSYISVAGIQAHGHVCEVCGAVTYRKIIDGTTVRFYFIGEDRAMLGPELNMTAKRWDAENGFLYLRREFLEHGGLCVVSGEQAENYMARHADKWDLVEEDGEQVYKIRYANSPYIQPDAVIEPMDIRGHEYNHKIVRLWDGEEYPEHGKGPSVPEMVSIYESWHWAPLETSPTLHRKVLRAIHNTDDKGWHHQDGRPWFTDFMFEEMGKYIRYFTTLDADEWDRQWPKFRKDGPGGIDDVARFCHEAAEVEDRPNVGNFIEGLFTLRSGQPLGDREKEAFALAAGDRDTRELIDAIGATSSAVAVATAPLPTKVPRRLKKALRKPMSRRTSHERRLVTRYLRRERGE